MRTILLLFFVIIFTPLMLTSSKSTVDVRCNFIEYLDDIAYHEQQERYCLKVEQEAFNRNVLRLQNKGVNMGMFLNQMGFLESRNNYKAVNRFGYMGKYQFSMKTLRSLTNKGFLKPRNVPLTQDLFLNDPTYQEEAMSALTRHNYEILKRYGLMRYVGKKINGVTTTKEGMLAAAHLLGPYAVKHYLKTGGSLKSVNINGINVSKIDGNGTSIVDYMKRFQNV